MTSERIAMLQNPTEDCNYSLIYAKRKIFQDLCQDDDLFEVLNNTDLLAVDTPHEDYLFVNIFPFLKIPASQSMVKNFICYDIDDLEDITSNEVMIRRQIKIRVASHEEDVKTPYGIPRQDVMAMIVDERMQWTEIFGCRLKKVYDSGKTAENGYYYRNMYYEQIITNNLQYGRSENMLDWKGRKTYSVEDSFS